MIRKLIWLALTAVFLLSAFVGSVDLHLQNIFHANSLDAQIFFDLRLPRVLFTFFAGAVLALSGLLFQTLFRNALMTPYTLGISSGAVLGAGIAIKLSLGTLLFGFAAISVFGFFGALFTVFLLLYLSRFLRQSHAESLLLLGIALSLFYSALLMVIFYLGSAMQNDMLIRFTMGSLSVIGWQYPLIISFSAIILFVAVYMYRFELQLLSISQDQAQLKGVNTKKVTVILLVISSFAIGTLVSISGPIGFVGLIVPHIVHKLYPVNISKRIIKTTLFGGLFLVLSDTVSRTLQTQSELPIGIITAIIGGPFFIYLIISRAQKR
ncbi:iron ABC transporter permease [Sulfurimonas sp. SWIR-19]|uniref:FecCD family ABC transporter permease n=1 Tax=Sulfurimonas sp. SWIR-19 TaxID=2878390 RepID=UPI001CF121EC|nr:iron ABC transporter permease [Sulfurimonas sp. SWIR-19]UCN00437.1 iron ABC transporter permease [Sulfurimonas sp. SWIR-19]